MASSLDNIEKIIHMAMKRWPQKKPKPAQINQAKLVAHRGAWNYDDCLENTLPAFAKCLPTAVWGIEFDIRWTKDNIPIVHHDRNTQRVFKKNLDIDELTYQAVNQAVPEIPKLSDVIDLMGLKKHLFIELKTQPTKEQAEILKSCLDHLEPEKDFHLMSLDPLCFEPLDNYYPKRTFVSIARANINSISQQTLEQHWGAITGHYLLLNSDLKKRCQEQSIKTGTGFIDSENLFFREVNRSIDWLFSNKAYELSQFIK